MIQLLFFSLILSIFPNHIFQYFGGLPEDFDFEANEWMLDAFLAAAPVAFAGQENAYLVRVEYVNFTTSTVSDDSSTTLEVGVRIKVSFTYEDFSYLVNTTTTTAAGSTGHRTLSASTPKSDTDAVYAGMIANYQAADVAGTVNAFLATTDNAAKVNTFNAGESAFTPYVSIVTVSPPTCYPTARPSTSKQS